MLGQLTGRPQGVWHQQRGAPMNDGPVFSGINHIGIVTGDIERAIRIWTDRYRVGPWRVFSYDHANMRGSCGGEPVDYAFRAALSQLSATTRVEIIQPLDDRGPYATSLARHAGLDHIHHIRMDVADFDESCRALGTGLQLPVILTAEFDGAAGSQARFDCAYFDTRADLGFVTEIGRAQPGFAMPDPDATFAVAPSATAPKA